MVKSPVLPGAAMLVATGLGKRYGSVVAVEAVDLEVPAGRIVGLVGNNGAGKTTTLKMLCGVLEPTSGTATVGGRSTLEAEARRA
ncbi:MAG: ATP-binding cassette domain-containing protein, partial [Candidatus Thermoplasmatota archaeon]